MPTHPIRCEAYCQRCSRTFATVPARPAPFSARHLRAECSSRPKQAAAPNAPSARGIRDPCEADRGGEGDGEKQEVIFDAPNVVVYSPWRCARVPSWGSPGGRGGASVTAAFAGWAAIVPGSLLLGRFALLWRPSLATAMALLAMVATPLLAVIAVTVGGARPTGAAGDDGASAPARGDTEVAGTSS